MENKCLFVKANDLKVIFLIFQEQIPQLSSDITFLKDEIQQFLGNITFNIYAKQ